jgi:hypothetical protein
MIGLSGGVYILEMIFCTAATDVWSYVKVYNMILVPIFASGEERCNLNGDGRLIFFRPISPLPRYMSKSVLVLFS